MTYITDLRKGETVFDTDTGPLVACTTNPTTCVFVVLLSTNLYRYGVCIRYIPFL